jgi:hypothetical protein
MKYQEAAYGLIEMPGQADTTDCRCDLHAVVPEQTSATAAAMHETVWRAMHTQEVLCSAASSDSNETNGQRSRKRRLLRWMHLQLAIHAISSAAQHQQHCGHGLVRPQWQQQGEAQS